MLNLRLENRAVVAQTTAHEERRETLCGFRRLGCGSARFNEPCQVRVERFFKGLDDVTRRVIDVSVVGQSGRAHGAGESAPANDARGVGNTAAAQFVGSIPKARSSGSSFGKGGVHDLGVPDHLLGNVPAMVPQFAFPALGFQAGGGGFLFALLPAQTLQQGVGGRDLGRDFRLQTREVINQGVTTRRRRVGVVGEELGLQFLELPVETFAPPFETGDFGIDTFPAEEDFSSSFCC
jgi:hypothetical protein